MVTILKGFIIQNCNGNIQTYMWWVRYFNVIVKSRMINKGPFKYI